LIKDDCGIGTSAIVHVSKNTCVRIILADECQTLDGLPKDDVGMMVMFND